MSALPTADSTHQTGVTISDGAVTGTLDYDAEGYKLDLTLAATASEGSPEVTYSYAIGSGSAVTLQSTQALIPITAADLSSTLTLSADAQGYTGDTIELDISGLTLEAEPVTPALTLSVTPTSDSTHQTGVTISNGAVTGTLDYDATGYKLDLTLAATASEGSPTVTYSYTLGSGSAVALQGTQALIPITAADLSSTLTLSAAAQGYEGDEIELDISGLTLESEPAADNVAGFFTMYSTNGDIYFNNIVEVQPDPERGTPHGYTADAAGSVTTGDKTVTIEILKSAFTGKTITEYGTYASSTSGGYDFVTFTEGTDSYTGTLTINEQYLAEDWYILQFGYRDTATDTGELITINLKGITVDT